MSERARGNAYEKEVVAILEEMGYVVERALPKIVWIPMRIKGRPTGKRIPISQSHDFFGCWDLIAKLRPEKADDPAEVRTLWVQVSTWEHASDKRKQVAGFPLNPGVDVGAIFGRVRGRPPHYRVLLSDDEYEWKGETMMLVKKGEKADAEKSETGSPPGNAPPNGIAAADGRIPGLTGGARVRPGSDDDEGRGDPAGHGVRRPAGIRHQRGRRAV